MKAALEIRKTEDGKLQARRKDGRPLTAEDREQAKELVEQVHLPRRAWLLEEIRSGSGTLRAVKICSAVLEDDLWLTVDRDFKPNDEFAIYYPEELEFLRTKPIEELKAVHQAKLTFPGSRIVQ